MDIFGGSNRLFDSVSDAESHDIKFLTGFFIILRNKVRVQLFSQDRIIFVALSNTTSAAPSFPSFHFENKVNTTEGAAEVIFKRIT